jgi:hypothetical protein
MAKSVVKVHDKKIGEDLFIIRNLNKKKSSFPLFYQEKKGFLRQWIVSGEIHSGMKR